MFVLDLLLLHLKEVTAIHVSQINAPHEPIHEEDVGTVSHSPPHVNESVEVMIPINPI